MQTELESARREWADGYRRLLQETADPAKRELLFAQVDAVTAELRRRVGSIFTLDELVAAYARSEPWLRVVVEERAAVPGWPRTLSVVGDAAFHLYSRTAADFEP